MTRYFFSKLKSGVLKTTRRRLLSLKRDRFKSYSYFPNKYFLISIYFKLLGNINKKSFYSYWSNFFKLSQFQSVFRLYNSSKIIEIKNYILYKTKKNVYIKYRKFYPRQVFKSIKKFEIQENINYADVAYFKDVYLQTYKNNTTFEFAIKASTMRIISYNKKLTATLNILSKYNQTVYKKYIQLNKGNNIITFSNIFEKYLTSKSMGTNSVYKHYIKYCIRNFETILISENMFKLLRFYRIFNKMIISTKNQIERQPLTYRLNIYSNKLINIPTNNKLYMTRAAALAYICILVIYRLVN